MTAVAPGVKPDPNRWPPRRWLVAGGSAIAYALLVAIPADLIDTPLFTREVPPTWWSWPALTVSAVLVGSLTATYVAVPGGRDVSARRRQDRPVKGGYAGGVLTFFAVGCPVCNKLVLLALGTSGAMTWFEPIQPVLSIAAVGVLAWALRARLRGQAGCRVRSAR